MANIKIITDSSCDLPKDLLRDLEVDVLPLNILLDNDSYVDGENITADEILEWSEKTKSTPKTSAPSLHKVYDLVEMYEKQDREAIFIGISEKISTTCNEVEMGIKNFNATKIKVVDSKSLSGGIGLLVLKASEMAREGYGLDEIYHYIQNMVNRINTSFVVDTLMHLYYGGRCNTLTAFIGSSLKLKPCINVIDGKMQVTKKYRGNNTKVMLNYADDVLANIETINDSCIVITHTGCTNETIEAVKEKIKNKNHFKDILVVRCSGVITSHGGPRTLGLFYETI